MPSRELDEALAHLDALAAAVVVAPDDEQLQRLDAVRKDVDLVERRVLDRRAAFLHEQVDGEDQPTRHERTHVLEELRLDEEPGGERSELTRDCGLERAHGPVGVVATEIAQHRPQRLALVHRDHRIRAVRALDHGATRICASSWSWTMLAGHSGSNDE